MIYDTKEWTYGCELEFADVDIRNILPEGNKWNKKDFSIVNSNGLANDPKGKITYFGGEINTKPTNTINEQIDNIDNIIKSLNPKPILNYKSNLHIHIRVPGLKDDLKSCKNIILYYHTYINEIISVLNCMYPVNVFEYPSKDEYQGAVKRHNRNYNSSHYFTFNSKQLQNILSANTIKEFYERHHPISTKTKKILYCFGKRNGINLKQLWDNEIDTVEFRFFFGTLDLNEYKNCFIFCKELLDAALNTNETPKQIFKRMPNLIFPKEMKYNHKLQKIYDLTNLSKNNYKKVFENIEKLKKEGVL